jgi:hypothetical protein
MPAGAPAHWRQRFQASGHRAFQGLRVLLHCPNNELMPSTKTLVPLLQAGGAEVVKRSAPFPSGCLAAANLAVLQQEEGTEGAKAEGELRGSGLLCVTPLFLVDWVAHPWQGLQGHVLCGWQEGGEVARLVAARAEGA